MPKYPNVVARGKRFYYRFQYNKRRLEIGGYATARDAYYEGRRYEEQTRHTSTVSDMTVTELCHCYIEKHDKAWNENTTVQKTRCLVNRYIVPVIGNELVRSLTAFQMVGYIDRVRQLSPATAFSVGRTLRKILNKAVEWEIIPVNPLRCKLPGLPKRDYSILTPAQLFDLINGLDGRDKYLIATAGLVGLRRSEIAGLRWDDFDFRKNTLHLQRQYVRGEIRDLKTDSSAAVIPLWPRYVLLMKQWKLESLPGGWVFRGRTDTPPSLVRWSSDRWHQIRRGYNLPDNLRFHDLRHTFASILLSHGANAKSVQKLLRHSSIKTTMETYRHLLPGELEEAFKVFNALGGENGGEGLKLSL